MPPLPARQRKSAAAKILGQLNKSRAAAGAKFKTVRQPTYGVLKVRAQNVGRRFAELARQNVRADSNILNKTVAKLAHGENKANALFSAAIAAKSLTGFSGKYRRIHDATDEVVGTALVEKVLAGVIESHKIKALNTAEIEYLSYVLALWSEFRNPTSMVGYRTRTGFMQHVTRASSAFYSRNPKKRGGGEHNRLDRMRQDRVISKVERHLQKQYTDLVLIVLKSASKGVRFTYRAMCAAPTAPNIILEPGVTVKEVKAATVTRERGKKRGKEIEQTYRWLKRGGVGKPATARSAKLARLTSKAVKRQARSAKLAQLTGKAVKQARSAKLARLTVKAVKRQPRADWNQEESDGEMSATED